MLLRLTLDVYWQVARGMVPAFGATSLGMLSSSSCLCLQITGAGVRASVLLRLEQGEEAVDTVESLLRIVRLHLDVVHVHVLSCIQCGAHASAGSAGAVAMYAAGAPDRPLEALLRGGTAYEPPFLSCKRSY